MGSLSDEAHYVVRGICAEVGCEAAFVDDAVMLLRRKYETERDESQRLRCVIDKLEQLLEPIASAGSAALALNEIRVSRRESPESADAVDPCAGSQPRPSTRDESSSGSLGRPPVPEAALRELVEQWRARAQADEDRIQELKRQDWPEMEGALAYRYARERECADELETLLRGGGTEETHHD